MCGQLYGCVSTVPVGHAKIASHDLTVEDHLAMFDEDRRNAWKEVVERAMKLTGLSLPPTPGAQEIVSLLKSLCFDYHQIFIQ